MRLALILLLLAGFAAPAQTARAAPDEAGGKSAREWIAGIGDAVASTDYRGTLVYATSEQVESIRVFHQITPDGVVQRLQSLSGEVRDLVRRPDALSMVGGLASVNGSATMAGLPRHPAGAAPTLEDNYALRLGPIDRVAGLPAQRVDLHPLDAYRYGHRLYLEQGSGLPLKSVMFGSDGRPVEHLVFADIELGRRPSAAELTLQPGTATVPRSTHPRNPTDATAGGGNAGAADWRVVDVPPGFLPVRGGDTHVAAGASRHLVYSDGLARVSLFIEPLVAGATPFSGSVSRGATQVLGRVTDGYQIIVVGEVPHLAVERFARGVVHED